MSVDFHFLEQAWAAFLSAPATILVLMFLAATAGWWLRGHIARERVDVLRERIAVREERIRLLGERLQDTDQKLSLATSEQARLQEQIEAKEAPEKLAATAAAALRHLQSATTSNTAARTIIVSFRPPAPKETSD